MFLKPLEAALSDSEPPLIVERPPLPRWHAAAFHTHGLPQLDGRIKASPEDFVVEEVPAYQPTGEGEHLYLWIEKRDVAADRLVQHVAQALKIRRDDIGSAGLKDRFAVTRQYLSVPATALEAVPQIDCPGIKVLSATRHRNKLKTGHLRGNRFRITVRDLTATDSSLPIEEAIPLIENTIARQGFPNYFGDQRFGNADQTLQLGLDLLTARKAPRDIPFAKRKFLLRLALSAVQSELFNRTVAERIQTETLGVVLPGDLLQVAASGGCFLTEDSTVDQPRYDSREVIPTGPLFGPSMKSPQAAALELEARVRASFGLAESAFSQFANLTAGARRAMVCMPEALSLRWEPPSLIVDVTLPAGSYATMLLREILSATLST